MARCVVFHFHFYKNAGSSVDAILKNNFVNQWEDKEFDENDLPSGAIKWILQSSTINCFSSHTATLDILNNTDVELIPIVFLRHPLDRIASVYNYEKIQTSDAWEHALARTSSMRQYIETRLASEFDAQCRNFHCYRLSELFKNKNDIESSSFDLAQKTLASLPIVGIVDRFQESLDIYKVYLNNNGFANLRFNETRENAVAPLELTLEDRLNKMQDEVGGDFFQLLTEVNKDDITLYELSVNKLERLRLALDL
jgi:hypothetical protein